jgi:CubicO group peptidase (beta-lactamase class C family)
MKSILCFVLLFVASFVGAQSKDEIEQYIAKQLAAQKITGLTIGIIENGKITLAKGYGVANLEQHIPASEKTVYKIGSLSKQMVATGIMLLVQSGKLALSDAVTNYYPDAPAAWSGITIRHLLNHTSGLIRESPVFDATEVKHDTVLIKAAYKVPLVFATGTKWQYCNLGYFMLADIIRKLSGKSFQQFMTEEVFSKHRLIHTQPTSTKTLIPNRAGGYVFAGKDSILENASDYIAFRPSGAFVSTITDMLQWELLIQNGKLLSTQSWQQMWTDTVSTDPANAKADFYGYGWRVDQFKGRTMVSHGGALPGFRSAYFRFPADKTAVIILTNSDHANGMLIAKGVVDLLYKSK